MATAIDQKRPKQNLGQHPRLARKAKPKPVTLGDDAAQVMLFYGLSEREYPRPAVSRFLRLLQAAQCMGDITLT
jgi:hypothetical protein